MIGPYYFFKRISIKRYRWASTAFRFYRINHGFMIHFMKFSVIVTPFKSHQEWV